MSKISKGDLVMIVGAIFQNNIGKIGTVTGRSINLKQYWNIELAEMTKTKLSGTDRIIFSKRGTSHENNLLRICPPPSQMIPDPVEAPVDEVVA